MVLITLPWITSNSQSSCLSTSPNAGITSEHHHPWLSSAHLSQSLYLHCHSLAYPTIISLLDYCKSLYTCLLIPFQFHALKLPEWYFQMKIILVHYPLMKNTPPPSHSSNFNLVSPPLQPRWTFFSSCYMSVSSLLHDLRPCCLLCPEHSPPHPSLAWLVPSYPLGIRRYYLLRAASPTCWI